MDRKDALYNWLQIKLVSDARPDDRAAVDTVQFFETILTEDHRMSEYEIASMDEETIYVRFLIDGESGEEKFDRELSEKLLHDINANPKYN